MLPTDIPDLQVCIRKVDRTDILPNRRNSWFRGKGRGRVEGLDGGEEGRLPSVVEAEKEDGIFYGRSD